MGFRFRKSIKIAPGIKLNLSKSGIGMTMGTKDARVSVNSKGRVTRSFSIPGTGISHVTTDTLKPSKNKEKKAKDVSILSEDTFSVSKTTDEGNIIENSSNLSSGNNLPPKKSKRWLIYIAITLIATMINARLLYPAILAQSIYHLIHVKKDLYDHPKKKKYTSISIGVIIFSIFGVFTSTFAPEPIPIETIALSVNNDTMDINENQNIQLHYTPENADISKLHFEVSDDSLAEISKLENGELELKTLDTEGNLSIHAETAEIKSDALLITIVDKEKQEAERIAAEKKAEDERIAAEKKAAKEKKAEEERIAAEKRAEDERIATEQRNANAAVSAVNTQKSNSRTVYVTPTGKKYHYSGSCNGGHYTASTLDDALSMGLTPCKKCVQ